MGLSKKIKIILVKRGMTVTALAEKLEMSQSNLSNRFKRDNFSDKELQQIADALDCEVETTFTLRDTGEKV